MELNRPRIRFVALTLAVLFCIGSLVFATPSHANFVMGSNLSFPGNNTAVDCGSTTGDCTLSPSNVRPTSPINGTIVRWGVRLDPGAPSVRLRVISNGVFSGSGIFHLSPSAGLNQFSESLPIHIGDQIGVDDPNPGFVLVQTGRVGRSYHSFVTQSDGSPALGTSESNAELLLNAEVEPTNTFALVSWSLKKRGLLLSLKLPNQGSLTVFPAAQGPRIVRPASSGSLAPAARFGLLVHLTRKAKRALHRLGKIKGAIAMTYTPRFGSPSIQTVTIKLKRKHQ